MGRKHKKQFRTENQTSTNNEPPLKLVLKVGKDGASSSITIPSSSLIDSTPSKDAVSGSVAPATPESGKRRKKRKRKHEDIVTVTPISDRVSATQTNDQLSDHTESETVETEGAETVEEEDTELSKADVSVEEDEQGKKSESVAGEEKYASMPFKKLYLSQPDKRYPPKAAGAAVGSDKELKIKQLVQVQHSANDATSQTLHSSQSVNQQSLADKDPLTKVLESLHTSLEKKDVDKFFAYPVTDMIAPGYSSIIAHAVDFSSMKRKIKDGSYYNTEEYKDDFALMCNNCMTYNQPETIYYRAAKKLLTAGQKIMSKERLAAVKRAFNYSEDVESRPKPKIHVIKNKGSESGAEGMDTTEGTEVESCVAEDIEEEKLEATTTLGTPDKEEEITDLEAEKVILQVLEAAKEAKDRLTVRKPNSKMGFLRREKDGTTTLNFVNPSNIAHPHDNRVVNLGMMTGILAHGSGSIPGFREDKRNKANPITYLYYGPFSSYAPQYDSTFSNLSKEESDLLYSTYGDETGSQYAQSIQTYIKDCDNYVTRMVDSLLDTMTNGEHSKTMTTIRENHKEPGIFANNVNSTATITSNDATKTNSTDVDTSNYQRVPADFDFDSLKSLSDLGIDMSFLPALAKDFKEKGAPLVEESQDVASQLDKASDLIEQLEKTQSERLSRKPPSHLQYVPGPSEQEYSIAERLNKQLQILAAKATPGGVISSRAVKDTMGICLDSQPITIEENSNAPIARQNPQPLQEDIEILDGPDDTTEGEPSKELLDLLNSPQHDKGSPEVVEMS